MFACLSLSFCTCIRHSSDLFNKELMAYSKTGRISRTSRLTKELRAEEICQLDTEEETSAGTVDRGNKP